MARNTRQGRKVGGQSRSRIVGVLTQRLAAQELLATREDRQRQYEAAVARWEVSQRQTAQVAQPVN